MIKLSILKSMRAAPWLVAICFAAMTPRAGAQQEWSWRFSADQYGKLSVPQRTTYDLKAYGDRATNERGGGRRFGIRVFRMETVLKRIFRPPEFALAHSPSMEGMRCIWQGSQLRSEIYTRCYTYRIIAIIQALSRPPQNGTAQGVN